MTLCYECENYNHVDCRKGKRTRKGKKQNCSCCCQTPGAKVKQVRFKK